MIRILRNKLVFLSAVAIFTAAVITSGCGAVESLSSIAGINKTGTVINRSWIRSSFSVVAADVLEVKRGQSVEILEEVEFERVKWYRVRATDEDSTEGWIEAQNVITSEMLEKSKKLAEEDKDLQPQATGRLRAVSNLRLAPDLNPENILYKLESTATFDIIAWKYVPKAQDAAEVDDAAKNDAAGGGSGGGQNSRRQRGRNAEVEAAREGNEPQDLNEKYDIWYKVRLDPSVSPAPAGWVFGRQVEPDVPTDIVFYQSVARKFASWQRLDPVDPKDKDAKTKPGSWVILTKSNTVKAKEGKEPDFDGILVLGYDKYNEEHYTVYRIENVWGEIPLRLEGTGDNKTFTVRLRNAAGQIEDKRFTVVKDPKGRLRVTPPPDVYTERNAR